MRSTRTSITSKIFALVAGVIFLNMSFVIAEFSALGISKSKLIENLINTGFEEEKETHESSGEGDSAIKELILSLSDNIIHHHISYLSIHQRSKHITNLKLQSGYYKIFSPPPDNSLI